MCACTRYRRPNAGLLTGSFYFTLMPHENNSVATEPWIRRRVQVILTRPPRGHFPWEEITGKEWRRIEKQSFIPRQETKPFLSIFSKEKDSTLQSLINTQPFTRRDESAGSRPETQASEDRSETKPPPHSESWSELAIHHTTRRRLRPRYNAEL